MTAPGPSRGRPFQQGRFEDLPIEPRVAHAYRRARELEIVVPSRTFGRVRVHCRELGSGPPLLLVHGLMTTSYSWRYLLDPLAASHRVIAFDLPGCGRSGVPSEGTYRAPALAGFVADVQRALDIRGSAVIGNSLGGYVCMHLALDDPESMARLVNIHSPAVAEARLHVLHAALRVPGMRGLLAWIIRRDPERWAHRHVHYFDESLKSIEEAREYGAALATPEGSRAFAAYLGEALAPDDLKRLEHRLEARRRDKLPFPVPLMLVYSTVDPMVPPRMGERLHELVPTSSLVWLESSSHFAHVDSPDRLLTAISTFLAG